MKKLRSKLKRNGLFIFIFIIGLAVAVYPLISQWYYRIESSEEIIEFTKKVKELDSEEINRRMELARAYNSTLDVSKLTDPYSDDQKKAGVAEYARMLQVGEMIGHVEIPKINENLPIYAGTSDSILEKGSGHLEGTSLPVGGIGTHTVLTAHRGLPTAKLFRNLDKLKEGDIFLIHNLETTLAYKVDQIMVVEPTNFEPVLVIEGGDYATLLTCTPYMINSHRLLVRGYRIDYTAAIDDGIANTPGFTPDYLQLFFIALPFAILLLLISMRQSKETRRLNREVKELAAKLGKDKENY